MNDQQTYLGKKYGTFGLTFGVLWRPLIKSDKAARKGLPKGATLAAKAKFSSSDIIFETCTTSRKRASSIRDIYFSTFSRTIVFVGSLNLTDTPVLLVSALAEAF